MSMMSSLQRKHRIIEVSESKASISSADYQLADDIFSTADKVLIVDFGSQYTQLIVRRVRELGVYSEIFAWQKLDNKVIATFAPQCIILSGGPESTMVDNSPSVPQSIFDCGVPVLGICYGMQAMTRQLGGKVESSLRREFGDAQVSVVSKSILLDGICDAKESDKLAVWMSHGDKVAKVPEGFKTIAVTDDSPVAAIADESRHYYGLQFHPEVTHTPSGGEILKRFIMDVANCRQSWTIITILDYTLVDIQKRVGDEEVILGFSGGVDSSVAAMLINRAIGSQLHCIFINTGLLRQNEAEQIVETFSKYIGVSLVQVYAEDVFFDALRGVSDPEEKRKIIGRVFIDLFEKEAMKLPRANWLAQGTIYPDVIESSGGVSGSAHLIKSHHNVGGLPERMRLKLLEPLSLLFKDEVRKLGIELGLSSEIVGRHPFPGPGLAVRIIGEVKKEYVELLRLADYIFIEELKAAGLYDSVSQAFVVFLPVKSVSVMGDGREYSYVVVLRAVETSDFMTANRSCLPEKFLDLVARRIVNEVVGISRVCYDITSKPPATIEWE